MNALVKGWHKMDKDELELGANFTPKFDENGLIPVIAQHFETREVLMLAYMNDEALQKTIKTKQAHYYSRSRRSLWLKGETSGQIQTVKAIKTDCDQDVVLLLVEIGGDGGCCHVGFANCFYRELDDNAALVINGKKPQEK
jgi:phosphoribosyl-AMP cyclohydrolase